MCHPNKKLSASLAIQNLALRSLGSPENIYHNYGRSYGLPKTIGSFDRPIFGQLSNFCTGSAEIREGFISGSPDPSEARLENQLEKVFPSPLSVPNLFRLSNSTVNQKMFLTREKVEKIVLSAQTFRLLPQDFYMPNDAVVWVNDCSNPRSPMGLTALKHFFSGH